MAAATILLGIGYGGLVASVYDSSGPSVAQQAELSRIMEEMMDEFRSRGRGPALVGGDFHAQLQVLPVGELRLSAVCADLSVEPTCEAANPDTYRRLDQVWLSSEMQVRLIDIGVSWSSGFKPMNCSEESLEGRARTSFRAGC